MMSDEREYIHLQVIEGKDLIARDSSGTSDPFITITYNNVVVGKTEIVYKTLNPKWDERTSLFAFPVEGSDPEIQLEIFDKDKHGSDRMGVVKVSIQSLTEGETSDTWHAVSKKKSKDKVSGSVHVRVSLIKSRDLEGHGAVMRAVKTGEVELLKRLLKSLAPSQFRVKDRLGNTVLHHTKGSDTYMTLLYDTSIEAVMRELINDTNQDGNTALHYFCMKHKDPDALVECLEAFTRLGANLTLRNKTGSTVLHVAAVNVQLRLLLLPLLRAQLSSETGLDFNTPNNSGETPLTMALKYKPSKETVKCLLMHGANPSVLKTYLPADLLSDSPLDSPEHSPSSPRRQRSVSDKQDKQLKTSGDRTPSATVLHTARQQLYQSLDNSVKHYLLSVYELYKWLRKIKQQHYFQRLLKEEALLDTLAQIDNTSSLKYIGITDPSVQIEFLEHCIALRESTQDKEVKKAARAQSIAAFKSFVESKMTDSGSGPNSAREGYEPATPGRIAFNWLIQPNELEYIDLIGNGVSSKVYKAMYAPQRGMAGSNGSNKGSQLVAIKVIKNSLLSDPNSTEIEDVKKEVEILSKIQSPHVVALYGVSISTKLCIVMEFCHKGSLLHVLKDGAQNSFDWPKVFKYILGAVRGVHVLHSASILHRDIKSLNLLVDSEDNIKVSDFGLSKWSSDGTSSSVATVMGTLEYCAPEVLDGALYSAKSDIFSLAVVLWEIVTCSLMRKWVAPYSAGLELESGVPDANTTLNVLSNTALFIIAVRAQNKRPLIAAHCPPPLARIIRQCWHPVPAKRPTCTELLSQLETLYESYQANPSQFDS
jgi:serine/threonine protein kinase